MHMLSRCASCNKTSSRLIKTTSWSSDDHTLIVHVNGRVILVMCLFSNAVQLTVLKHIQFLTWPTFVSRSQWRCVDSKMTSALFWSLACHAICECSCDLDSKQPRMIWYVVVCHGRDELIIYPMWTHAKFWGSNARVQTRFRFWTLGIGPLREVMELARNGLQLDPTRSRFHPSPQKWEFHKCFLRPHCYWCTV